MAKKTGKTSLRQQFNGLYVFGDSLSDYGSRAAEAQLNVFAPDASPPWSGVTFSNSQSNWQTDLSKTLDLRPGRLTNQDNLPADPYFLYANSLVSPPELTAQTRQGTSYAMGGATSGFTTLYQFTDPTTSTALGLDNLGVASQVFTALSQQNVRIDSDELAVVWAGGNDLLVAFGGEQPLDTTLNQLIEQLRNDLETVLRFGGARQAMLSAVSPIQGEVNGVPYQAPFLSGLILAGSSPTAPEWLKGWVNSINEGVIEDFRNNVQVMVDEVQRAFPYANLINFNPEYEAQYKQFGKQLGDFASYGIDSTLGSAQSPVGTDGKAVNSYAYFDDIHPTRSGHKMLGNAIELQLQSASRRTEAATLTNTIESRASVIIGSDENDLIIGKGNNQKLLGRRGNDVLIGRGNQELLDGGRGDDFLEGGGGNERLRGGTGADFFSFSRADTELGEIDRILDFNAQEGDRLGINAVLGISNSLTGQSWTYIDSEQFSGAAGQLRFADGLLQGDLNGDGIANLQIQLNGITAFSTDWIS